MAIFYAGFLIKTKHTDFIKGNNGVNDGFIYQNSTKVQQYGTKKMKEGWYSWISPSPE